MPEPVPSGIQAIEERLERLEQRQEQFITVLIRQSENVRKLTVAMQQVAENAGSSNG